MSVSLVKDYVTATATPTAAPTVDLYSVTYTATDRHGNVSRGLVMDLFATSPGDARIRFAVVVSGELFASTGVRYSDVSAARSEMDWA